MTRLKNGKMKSGSVDLNVCNENECEMCKRIKDEE